MTMRRLAGAFAAALALVPAGGALAHSASDAYLTLVAAGAPAGTTRVEARIDVALRDLDFALGLDGDGNGGLTWAEVRAREAAIRTFLLDGVQASAAGSSCKLVPERQQIAMRSDGAYLAFFFAVTCAGQPRAIDLDYRLFFALDPSHRGIVVLRGRAGTSTALLSPALPRIRFDLSGEPSPRRAP